MLLGACGTPHPARNDSGEGPLQVRFGEEIPAGFASVFLHADEIELIAIDPDWPTKESLADPKNLHGYNIRGRAKLADRQKRLELLAEFSRGAMENDGVVAACFNPRHVLRAQHEGRTCDIIICFECLSFKMVDESGHVANGDIAESPAPYFNRVFAEAGLSVAGRQP